MCLLDTLEKHRMLGNNKIQLPFTYRFNSLGHFTAVKLAKGNTVFINKAP